MIKYRDLLSDTICSPITPPGYSGVAVIRISGDRAYSTVKSMVENKSIEFESHKTYLATVLDKAQNKIDQVLLAVFKKGQSFTGDETVEISCHGNPLLVNSIIKRCLEEGCRSAEKGEFSFRAYYNGKIDLIQAESIHELVTTKIKKGSETFIEQLQGQLSDKFTMIQEQLVLAMAHLEATIDFVEQDLDADGFEDVEKIVDSLLSEVNSLLKSYDVGKSLNKDLNILLLGATNVGKSSLFNRLVNSDRAIVTDVAGTTRDLVTEQQFLGNSSVKFSDSAGLRETSDTVESIGIQKSLESAKLAEVILFVVDATDPVRSVIPKSLDPEKVIIVYNKIDLTENRPNFYSKDLPGSRYAYVSSLTSAGIPELLDKIENQICKTSLGDEGVVVTQARHFNHLTELEKYVGKALALLKVKESPDLISQELLLGLSEVHQLLGKEYDDEVLDKIFSQFCIGK